MLRVCVCMFCSSVHAGELHNLRSWIEEQLQQLSKREKSSRADIAALWEHDKEVRQRLDDMKKEAAQKETVLQDMLAAINKVETDLNYKINQT